MADDLRVATAPDGAILPVIDVTDPRFSVPHTEAELTALAATALAEEQRRGPLQRLLMRVVLRGLARRSRLVAALQAADGGYLGGIATYVMKLPPALLPPPYDTEIDRRIVMSPTVQAMRIRLHQVAHLLAGALAPRLAVAPAAPLGLLDIAGGPSSDALNALLLLERQGLIGDRKVDIRIYDLDADGPAFAAGQLASLREGPLRNRAITLQHVPGNWADLATLRAAIAAFPDDAVLAATSEGGLFEYGTDTDITGVLAVLASRFGTVTGSVTRDDELNRLLRRHSRARTIPRGLNRFAQLAGASGYRIAESRPSPLSDQVLLDIG